MFKKGFILFIFLLSLTNRIWAIYTVDSVRLTIEQSEKRFLDSNLSMLIGKTNVDVQRALEIQARLWDNPNFSYEMALYNPATKHFLPVGTANQEGAINLQLQQLIRIGGKRRNQVKLAKYQTELTEYQYYDLLRSLKYQLRSDLCQVDLCLKNAATYAEQIGYLQNLTGAMQPLADKGDISEKDLVRMQSDILSLRSDERSNYESLLQAENDLKLMLKYQKNEFIIPVLNEPKDVSDAIRNISIDSLNNIALSERYDVKVAKLNMEMSGVNLKLQRSLAVPDPTVFADYARYGNAFNDYTGVGVSFDLPLANRNQGNIKSAKAALKAAQYTTDNAYINLYTDVETSLLKILNISDIRKSFDQKYTTSSDKIFNSMLQVYRQHQISLFEFLDYFDSFGEAKRNLNQLHSDYRLGIYDLNYTLGKDVF